MSKKLKYDPTQQPRNITEIGKGYIQEFYAAGVKSGSISQEKLDAWIKKVEEIEASTDKKGNPLSPMKKFAAIRQAFVDDNFPQLKKKSETAMSDYFKSLKA